MIQGRTVDVVRTPGGLTLPESDSRGVTIFAIIDAVGPDVTKYRPGQVVLPHHINNIYVRGGFHQIIFNEDDVWAVVEDLDASVISFGGSPPSKSNGQSEVEGAPA